MTDEPAPVDLDAIRAAVHQPGWWTAKRPVVELLVTALDERDAEIRQLRAENERLIAEIALARTGTHYPSMGDAVGAAMAHNARLAANVAATRAAQPAHPNT